MKKQEKDTIFRLRLSSDLKEMLERYALTTGFNSSSEAMRFLISHAYDVRLFEGVDDETKQYFSEVVPHKFRKYLDFKKKNTKVFQRRRYDWIGTIQEKA